MRYYIDECLAPVVKQHEGVLVVRDDLLAGGTKTRFIPALFDRSSEVVYASSAEGGTQTALATVAKALGKRATIFAPARATPHPRQLEAMRLGAQLIPVRPGYLNVVQARARKYCEQSGATLAPFGMRVPGCIEVVANAARQIDVRPAQVWCAAGSGTLATALRCAWPDAEHHAVQVGHKLTRDDVAGATIHEFHAPYSHALPDWVCPFPADGHYERKAWVTCITRCSRSKPVLFWNVMGAAAP
jgi:hypothetical protein